MVRSRYAPLLALVGAVAFCAPAAAEEQGVIRARLDLNRVETTLKSYKTLSERKANQLLGTVKRAEDRLAGCKDKQAAPWKKEAQRAGELKAAIHARAPKGQPAGGTPTPAPTPPPPPKPGAKSSPHTVAATALLDRTEQELSSLKYADRTTYTRLKRDLQQAANALGKVPNPERGDPAWKGALDRLRAIEKQTDQQYSTKPATPTRPSATGDVVAEDGSWGRCGAKGLKTAAPPERVWSTRATASSFYSGNYTPARATGAPNLFPRYGDYMKAAWACKNENSAAEWLKVSFPRTVASHVLVYETFSPGAIRKVIVDGKQVFATTDPALAYKTAQVFWVKLDPPRAVGRVEIHLQPSLVKQWPQIDTVALVPTGEAATASAAPTGPGVKRPLDSNDQHYFDRVKQHFEPVQKSLAKYGGGTILSSPDTSKPTHYETRLHNARVELQKVNDQENAQVVAMLRALAAAEKRVQELKAESIKQLEALLADGDYKARLKETCRDLYKNGNDRVPRFPYNWSPFQITQWVNKTFKPNHEKTKAQLELILRTWLWAPDVGSMRNEAKSAERTARVALSRAAKMTDGSVESAKSYVKSCDPATWTVKELREEAFKFGVSHKISGLLSALKSMRCVVAFHKALSGEVPAAIQKVLDDLLTCNKGVLAKVQVQISSERLTPMKPEWRSLLKIGKGVFDDALAVAVTTDVETKEGTWTSKDRVSSTSTTETYWVKSTPYKCQTFWVQVATPDKDRPGYVIVHDYNLRKFAYGAKVTGKWVKYNSQKAFVMRVENLPR